jgi:hypothetical protein
VEVCKNGHPRTEENTRVRVKDGYLFMVMDKFDRAVKNIERRKK